VSVASELTQTEEQVMTETMLSAERRDLLETLNSHREFLRFTAQGLTDEQARQTPTVSALSVGGIIKHVAATESGWAEFIVRGTEAVEMDMSEEAFAARSAEFVMQPGETLAGLVAEYDAVAQRTNDLVAEVADLDASHGLPDAPWFEPGARWSIRRALLHIIAETSQHAGHADIVREAIDGAKTMG
jgi:uncharacterized damage-inducible protein DinB